MLSHKGDICITPVHKAQGASGKRRQKDWKTKTEAKQQHCPDMAGQRHSGTQKQWLPGQDQASKHCSMERGDIQDSTFLNEEVLSIDACWRRWSQYYVKMWLLVCQPCIRGQPHTLRSAWVAQMGHWVIKFRGKGALSCEIAHGVDLGRVKGKSWKDVIIFKIHCIKFTKI